MDLLTPAFKGAAAIAQRLPAATVDALAPRLAALASLRPSNHRRMVERHQGRVQPHLGGAALRRQTRKVFESYGRYYGESFRLPAVDPAELDARLTVDGFEHIEAALEAGLGPILALPHLGSWEWCAYWLTRVRSIPVTAVAERLEPPELFEWFADFRARIGMNVVPLGPDAGREVVRAIKARHVVALLCDRDITGGGVEVEFFGECTALPGGPVTLALRTGAALLPTAVYDRDGTHHAVVRPPLDVARHGSFREDVRRITQDLATTLEDLIRAAPEQWHLLQPNWPSDRAPLRL